MGHTAAEVTKDICGEISKGAIDQNTATRWVKKFHSGCKNLNNQAMSGRPKIVDSKAMLQAP